MRLTDDVKAIVASILTLGVATREKSEAQMAEIFKRMFCEMEKVERELTREGK